MAEAAIPPPTDHADLPVTHAMRDYLKSAYRLAREGKPLTITSLSDARHVAPASATAMVKKLAALKLVDHLHYGDIQMTAEGTRQALLAIRRHRLLECFLVRILHFRIDEVHEESHALEPVISDKLERKIDEVLGHPKRCPHGDPIPDINGLMDEEDGIPLTQLNEGAAATILRIPGSKPDLLRHLLDIGVEPEKPIALVKREPFGGSLHLKLDKETILLSQQAAGSVYVIPKAS